MSDAAPISHPFAAVSAISAAVERGLALSAAAGVITAAAAEIDPRSAAVLRQVAAALPAHPEPIRLCQANYGRFEAALASDPERWPPGVDAVSLRLAANALWSAASRLQTAWEAL